MAVPIILGTDLLYFPEGAGTVSLDVSSFSILEMVRAKVSGNPSEEL